MSALFFLGGLTTTIIGFFVGEIWTIALGLTIMVIFK